MSELIMNHVVLREKGANVPLLKENSVGEATVDHFPFGGFFANRGATYSDADSSVVGTPSLFRLSSSYPNPKKHTRSELRSNSTAISTFRVGRLGSCERMIRSAAA